jgi:predicted GIY-YIG superfamily endonuclease
MRFLRDYGLWKVDEIQVRVVEDNLAWIDYEKYEKNADRHRIVVRVGFLERRKGITLEEKIGSVLAELKNKLIKDNEKIKRHKEIESKFN